MDVSCSWVNNQQERAEANLITNVPSSQPSVPIVNHEEMVPVRDDGSIGFSEAAIQVDTDLFVCPPLKGTKRAEELEDVGDDSSTITKGNKRKSTPQSTNI